MAGKGKTRKIISLAKYRDQRWREHSSASRYSGKRARSADQESDEPLLYKAQAKELIEQAADLLGRGDKADARLSWLLEDCLLLFGEEEKVEESLFC